MFSALCAVRAEASARGFYSYVRIQGDRPGQTGSLIVGPMASQVIQPTLKPNVAPAPAVSASHGINPNAVVLAKPPPTPAPRSLTLPCSAIDLTFTPESGYAVQGTYQPDSAGGCLFIIPLAANAPQSGRLNWRGRSTGGGMTAGKARYGPLHSPNPFVTLKPKQTQLVEIDYDPNNNIFEIWPI